MSIKRNFKISTALFFAVFTLFSCNNQDYNTIPSNPVSSNPTVPGNLSGILTSILVADSVNLGVQEAVAVFFPTPGDTAHVKLIGGVSVNSIPLDVDIDSAGYMQNNLFQSSLNMFSTSDWTVVGDSIIPSFSYSHHIPFPIYSGTLPDTINRNSGFTLTINSSTLSDADSVAITVGVDSNGKAYVGNYSANAGTITFLQSDLVHIVPGISIMQLIAYKKTVQTFGGKNFLFAKESITTHPVWVQ